MGSNKIIGEKIKNIREMKNISVVEMAERSGLEEDQITRIEGNEDFPSLAPLIKIARVLGVRLGTFLDDQQELGPVICRRESLKCREGIGFTNNAVTKHKFMSYHALSTDKSGRHMEPFIIDVEPSKDADFVFSTHEGEEFIYVIEGTIEINYGKNVYALNEGDSIYYDSIVAHHVHAANSLPAKILGVIYTPY
ncbi:MAG: XRE family transcriptional regulator [Tannerella sp.]|jgi:mannose-6-phosphate isomerase-like protein (cupin superfamily)/DNA-binding XRE family transcriptional regulator|nr:XRE family transcriptional regulator [Tannerella sp.]